MKTDYHIKLKNEYDFKYLCAQKSIEAFESTLTKGNFPSRFTLINHLIKEVIVGPFYLASKICEIAVNILRMCAKPSNLKSLNFKDISNTAELIILQTLIPVTCLVMRISAEILGLVYVPLAIRGWKLAENGESLSYLLWSDFFIKFSCHNPHKKIYADIYPSNADYYLEKNTILPNLEQEVEEELELEIATEFGALLQMLIQNDPERFNCLFDYDKATDPKTKFSSHVIMPLTPDLKQILFCLKELLIEEYANPEDLCDRFWEELSPKEIHKLFIYTSFHLRGEILDGNLNSNTKVIENHLNQLMDLFSRRFSFGRARFPASMWDIQSVGYD